MPAEIASMNIKMPMGYASDDSDVFDSMAATSQETGNSYYLNQQVANAQCLANYQALQQTQNAYQTVYSSLRNQSAIVSRTSLPIVSTPRPRSAWRRLWDYLFHRKRVRLIAARQHIEELEHELFPQWAS